MIFQTPVWWKSQLSSADLWTVPFWWDPRWKLRSCEMLSPNWCPRGDVWVLQLAHALPDTVRVVASSLQLFSKFLTQKRLAKVGTESTKARQSNQRSCVPPKETWSFRGFLLRQTIYKKKLLFPWSVIARCPAPLHLVIQLQGKRNFEREHCRIHRGLPALGLQRHKDLKQRNKIFEVPFVCGIIQMQWTCKGTR